MFCVVARPAFFLVVLSSAQFWAVAGSEGRHSKKISAGGEKQCPRERAGVSQLQVQQGLNSLAVEQTSATEQQVRRAGYWDVISPIGVKFTDVAQGELGTCYFLAVLIAIARLHPKIIEGMFVKRDLWNATPPIYTTKWLVDGRPTEVAVDDTVPVHPETGQLFFVHYNDGADFWPIILEKSWAKIFGAYKLVDGGTMAEAFKAITQAPVDLRTHDENLDTAGLWQALVEATDKRYPVGAGSRRNWVGIPSGHAYAVFNVTEAPVYGKMVLLYNPWAEDRYRGSVPNPDKEDGLFRMTFDEYVAAYHHTTIAAVREGYGVSSRLISTHARVTTIATELFVPDDEPFSVQLEWPNARFTEGCKVLKPGVTMVVAKDTDGTLSHIVARQRAPFLPVSRADLPGGAGRYVVFATATFPNGPWLEEIVLNTYASGPVEFRTVNHTRPPIDYLLQMYNMCGVISVDGLGEFELRMDMPVGGLPTFLQKTEGDKQGKIIYWDPEREEDVMENTHAFFTRGHNAWRVAGSMTMAHFRQESDMNVDVANAVSCIQEDWVPAHLPDVALSQSTKSGIRGGHASGGDVSSDESTDMPSHKRKVCRNAVRRLMDLSNAEEIIQNGSDPLFPPNASSIGSGDEVCGDVAQDIQEKCSKYNHWDTFAGVMANEEARIAKAEHAVTLRRKCIEATPNGELCLLKNTCKQAVHMSCDTGGTKSVVHHKLQVPAEESGFVDMLFCHCEAFSSRLLSLPNRIMTAQLQRTSTAL